MFLKSTPPPNHDIHLFLNKGAKKCDIGDDIVWNRDHITCLIVLLTSRKNSEIYELLRIYILSKDDPS